MRRIYGFLIPALIVLSVGMLWQASSSPRGSSEPSVTVSPIATPTPLVETRIVEVTARPTKASTRPPQPTNEPYVPPTPTKTATPPFGKSQQGSNVTDEKG